MKKYIGIYGMSAWLLALISMSVDYAVSSWFLSRGMTPEFCLLLSFFPASIIAFFYWSRRQIKDGKTQLGLLIITILMAFFLRGGVYDTIIRLGWSAQGSIIVVVIATVIHSYIGIAFINFFKESTIKDPTARWRAITLGVAGYMFFLRLYYIGSIELLPQEAYYWLYSRHLDFGYLDHPPMVAWIIWVNSLIFGNSEFSIRFGAFLLWLVTAFFCFRLTSNLFNRTAAFTVITLLAVLPFFAAVGFMMTPDAPLTACWAGALFFLERALVGRDRLSWWGAGICVGLGLLSKYTIILLVPVTFVFILVDRESSRWLWRREPYFAALVSIFLFLPVLLWNAEHEWMSFIFQGPRRLSEGWSFNLPQLIGSVLLLLTPTGAIAAFSGLNIVKQKTFLKNRRDVFFLVFMLCPFLVFIIFSCSWDVKLNWTGPIWLITLPFMAQQMIAASEPLSKRLDLCLQRAWLPTIIICVFFWGGSLYFLSLGAPGISYVKSDNIGYITGWRNLAFQIETIEDNLERATGIEPLVIGMDKNKIASELAYYRNKLCPESEDEGFLYTTGRHIFGMDSLMFKYWARERQKIARKEKGQCLILVSNEFNDLQGTASMDSSGWIVGEVKELIVEKVSGFPVGKYFYAIATPKESF